MRTADLIIADLTIWARAVDGRLGARQQLFHLLRRQGRLAAPGMIFSQLLAETEDESLAARIRTWALEVPPLSESPAGWLAAGDLGRTLRRRGIELDPPAMYALALSLRESAPLWSLDPAFVEVADVLPLRRFDPADSTT